MRLGGDEFIVVAPDLTSWAAGELVAARLLQAVREASGETGVSASVGVAPGRGLLEDRGELVARADAAMHEAKRAGGAVRIVAAPT